SPSTIPATSPPKPAPPPSEAAHSTCPDQGGGVREQTTPDGRLCRSWSQEYARETPRQKAACTLVAIDAESGAAYSQSEWRREQALHSSPAACCQACPHASWSPLQRLWDARPARRLSHPARCGARGASPDGPPGSETQSRHRDESGPDRQSCTSVHRPWQRTDRVGTSRP